MTIDLGTHNYVGTWPCGCILAVVCDVPGHEKYTARSVSLWIKRGVSVSRILHEEFRSLQFGHRLTCEIEEHREKSRRSAERREKEKVTPCP